MTVFEIATIVLRVIDTLISLGTLIKSLLAFLKEVKRK